MGYKVVNEGQQAILFSRSGSGKLIIGPRRLYVGTYETLEILDRRVATQTQYLVVKYRDGKKEHIRGPLEMFWNRLEVVSIEVKESIKLDSNHLLVVYRQEEGHIDRRIVRGPAVFVPGAQEWLHEFVWHGEDPRQSGRMLPKAKKFTQLCHVPHQFYYDVREVRTVDDTLITVKLMLFYELVNIETMLTYTHDPIADFINAVASDVIGFATQLSYAEFLQQTHQLNELTSYPQLTSRAERIGYGITKVVYRGYHASASLQSTHDDAIQTRTYLKLQTEAEEQQQTLEQFKLQRQKERTKLEQEVERRSQEHRHEIDMLQQKHVLDVQALQHDSDLKQEQAKLDVDLELVSAENQMKQSYLQSLKNLQVDMTSYLVSVQAPFAPQQEIIVGPPTTTQTPISHN